jgi:hypothetical protein
MAKMLYSAQQYVKKLNGFKSYIQKVKPSDDFTLVKERLLDALDTMYLYLEDMILSCEAGSERKKCETHKTLVDSFKNTVKIANTSDDLITITSLLDLLNPNDMEHMNEFRLHETADGLLFGYKECFINIPGPYLNILRDAITNQNINIFFPNCFDGTNAKFFGRETDTTYGQEAKHITNARAVLNRVAKGELKGSTISNNFFDALFLVPKIGYREEKDSFGVVKEPIERIEIKNTIKYLRPGGLFLITIPYTRLVPSLAMYLSKNLSNVRVTRVPNGDVLKRITIIGTKNSINSVSDKDIYNKLKFLNYDTDTISIHDLEMHTYNLPTEELTLEFFRGSQLDITDVQDACADNMLDSFLNSQMDPLVVKDQAPLLPFNIGQVGLVLTSGCLDGVIEEMEGINHVIKGMTTKVVSTNREDVDDNTIKCTETINNQVKINIFTADGKYIQLG